MLYTYFAQHNAYNHRSSVSSLFWAQSGCDAGRGVDSLHPHCSRKVEVLVRFRLITCHDKLAGTRRTWGYSTTIPAQHASLFSNQSHHFFEQEPTPKFRQTRNNTCIPPRAHLIIPAVGARTRPAPALFAGPLSRTKELPTRRSDDICSLVFLLGGQFLPSTRTLGTEAGPCVCHQNRCQSTCRRLPRAKS